MRDPLTAQELADLATDLPEWRVEGGCLVRDVEAPSFAAAIEWVVRIGEASERLDHHPDIDIRWKWLHVVLTTHSAGGQVTELDVLLAREIDAITR